MELEQERGRGTKVEEKKNSQKVSLLSQGASLGGNDQIEVEDHRRVPVSNLQGEEVRS